MDVIEKHVKSIEWIREELLSMDELANPVMGISDWDDAVCIDFGGKKLVVSSDGPYSKRLVLKSALIHASTDVVVKGARPIFALDTLIGSKKEVAGMLGSLKAQALALKIPLLGGNTLFEESDPRCSLTVVGELLLTDPIRDSGSKSGDIIALIGDPIWGEQDERIELARTLFECWFEILSKGVKINAAKDVTKGGLVSVVFEMEGKSGRKFNLNENIPYPVTRNLDNFLVTAKESEMEKIEEICKKKKCSVEVIGSVE
ncbi:MAG: AIR synthase related protein [Methanobacteriota archaeon]